VLLRELLDDEPMGCKPDVLVERNTMHEWCKVAVIPWSGPSGFGGFVANLAFDPLDMK
jgi:hypothetical protein